MSSIYDPRRQEAIESILTQLFAEDEAIKQIAAEIKETKQTLKDLSETRDEHVGKVGMLMDELKKVSNGEFQPTLFGGLQP